MTHDEKLKDNQFEIHTTINGNVYVWDKWGLDSRYMELGCYIFDVVDIEYVFEDKIIWGGWWVFRWRKGVERVMIRSIPKKEKRDFGSIESAETWIDERMVADNAVVSRVPHPPVNEVAQ